jgi:hypothetical protein
MLGAVCIAKDATDSLNVGLFEQICTTMDRRCLMVIKIAGNVFVVNQTICCTICAICSVQWSVCSMQCRVQGIVADSLNVGLFKQICTTMDRRCLMVIKIAGNLFVVNQTICCTIRAECSMLCSM